MNRSTAAWETTLYLILTYALAVAVAAAMPHAGINRLATLLLPTISVTVLTFTVTARRARRGLWRGFSLTRPRANDSRVWQTALLVPALILALAYGTALVGGYAGLVHLSAAPDEAASFVADLLISLALGSVLVLGEEIGWRGYLLPRIQQLVGPRRAAFLTGFAHGCFHLPLILIATTYDTEGSRWFVAPSVVATITAAGVFYAYVRDRSAGIWPVAVAHNAANTLFDIGSRATVATGSAASLAYVAGESGIATLASVVMLAAWLLRRPWPTRDSGSVAVELEAAR